MYEPDSDPGRHTLYLIRHLTEKQQTQDQMDEFAQSSASFYSTLDLDQKKIIWDSFHRIESNDRFYSLHEKHMDEWQIDSLQTQDQDYLTLGKSFIDHVAPSQRTVSTSDPVDTTTRSNLVNRVHDHRSWFPHVTWECLNGIIKGSIVPTGEHGGTETTRDAGSEIVPVDGSGDRGQ